LDVPVTEHSYEDMSLMKQATKVKLPPETFNVEYHFIKELHEVTLDDARKYLDKFAGLDKNRDGMISEEEFGNLLGLPRAGYAKLLFQLFDEDQSGYIDWRVFFPPKKC
jgi:hypothetical protein